MDGLLIGFELNSAKKLPYLEIKTAKKISLIKKLYSRIIREYN